MPVSETALRIIDEAIPSVHSCVSALNSPYSSPIVMHFGLKMYVFTSCAIAASSWPLDLSAPIADCSARMQHDLPPPVGPTVITPKRTFIVW